MRIEIDVSDIVNNLQAELQAEIKLIEEKTDELAADFEGNVKRQTPVDTGRARGGWHTIKTQAGVTVENDVEYIEYLNRGHSKQAPAGFIEAALDASIRRQNAS